MNFKRLILAVIVVALFHFMVGGLTCGCIFSWVYKIEPINVWKPMENFPFMLVLATTFFIDLLFVLVYAIINKGVPGKNRYAKGLLYGLFVWMVGLVPGLISTYLFMTVATTVVIYWTIWGLIVSPLKGLITAAIYGE